MRPGLPKLSWPFAFVDMTLIVCMLHFHHRFATKNFIGSLGLKLVPLFLHKLQGFQLDSTLLMSLGHFFNQFCVEITSFYLLLIEINQIRDFIDSLMLINVYIVIMMSSQL